MAEFADLLRKMQMKGVKHPEILLTAFVHAPLDFLDISRDLSAYAGILMMLDDPSNDRLGSCGGIKQRLVVLIMGHLKHQQATAQPMHRVCISK